MSKVEESIIKSIEKNGFPEKRVSLPFKPILESCKTHGVRLPEVLKNLEQQGIFSKNLDEKILFFSPEKEAKKTADAAGFKMPEGIFQQAMEQFKSMSPEDQAALKSKIESMSPEERAAMLKQAQEMFKGK